MSKSQNARWRRIWAGIAGIVIFLAALFGFLADTSSFLDRFRQTPSPTLTPMPFEPAAEGEVLIIVADFYLASGIADAQPHERIYDKISEISDDLNLKNLRVEKLPLELRNSERERVQFIGQEYNASMIIWGEETSTQMDVYFLDLKNPSLPASAVNITEVERVYISSLSKPEPYIEFINIDLPKHLSYLALFAIGKSQFSSGDFVAARDTLSAAIEAVSADEVVEGLFDAHIMLGDVYLTRNEYELAIAENDKAVELAPNEPQPYLARGSAYLHAGLWQDALDDFDMAIEINPNYAWAFYTRGIAYKYLA